MIRAEVVEQIKAQCEFLEKDGYVFHHQPNRVWYEKNEETRGFVIAFNYLVYDFLDVYGLTAYMRFNEVENVFQQIQHGRLEDFHTIHIQFHGDDFREMINQEILPTKDNYHFEISGTAGAVSYAALITAFYKEKVLPFFNTYAAISAVNDWVASQPVNEHSNLISSDGNAMVLRRIMIMYYAGDNGYEGLLNEYKAYLETKKNESVFRNIYQDLLEMEKHLHRLL